MKVIFIQDVPKQGQKGDIKEVKDGYAKNYLIKNNLAVILTEESLKRLTSDEKAAQTKEEQKLMQTEQLKKQLENLTLTFTIKVGQNEKAYGSISPKQISEALEKEGFKIDKKSLMIEQPLTSLGVFPIKVKLYKNIEANLTIHLIKQNT